MTAVGPARSVEAAPVPTTPAGTWQAGPPVPAAAGRLRVDNKPVLVAASCPFTFTPSSTGSPLDPTSVALNAQGTRLRCDGRPLLLDGDTERDKYGNTLEATGPGRLRTERRQP